MVQHINRQLLERAGFAVTVAGTGAEAVRKFSQGKYQLVYMDIGLPDTTGYEIARAIRKQDTFVPIVALTGHGALDVKQDCDEAGIQGVISKPLTSERIKDVWEQYKLKFLEEAQLIDRKSMLELLGSQTVVEELLVQWRSILEQHLLVLKTSIDVKDIKKLREELHAMIGALSYVKMPALYESVKVLQKAAREENENLLLFYQGVVEEAGRINTLLYAD